MTIIKIIIIILAIVGGIFLYTHFVSAEFGYDNPTLPRIESPSVTVVSFTNTTPVNSSTYANCWSTAEGVKCDVADITYDEISGGDVNALGYTGYFNYIQGAVGQLSMDGDPWYLGGTDLQIAENLIVDGNLTANKINDLNLSSLATGFSIAGGTTSKTLTITDDSTINQNLTTASNPTFAGLGLFAGDVNKTLGMKRATTGDNAGKSLTVHSGGATLGYTNKEGGDLVLSSGASTGTGGSKIVFQTASKTGSGSFAVDPSTKWSILESGQLSSGTDGTSAFDIKTDGKVTADEGQFQDLWAFKNLFVFGNFNPNSMTVGDEYGDTGKITLIGDFIKSLDITMEQVGGFGTETITFPMSTGTVALMGGAIENKNNFTISGRMGIGTTTPSYPLEVRGNTTSDSISIWAERNISATGYLTRTSVFDSSKGSALDFIQDSEYYKENGIIQHDRFYGYAGEYETVDYSRPEIIKTEEEVCRPIKECIEYAVKNETLCIKWEIIDYECETVVTEKTIYPYTISVPHISITDEIDVLRQALFDVKTDFDEYKNCIRSVKVFEDIQKC